MPITDFLFSLKGRIGRLQWWLYVLIASFPTGILDDAWERADSYGWPLLLVLTVASVAPLWMFIAVSVKRLHDADMSGWLIWLLLVPGLGMLALLVMNGFVPGTTGPNRYGEPYGQKDRKADRP